MKLKLITLFAIFVAFSCSNPDPIDKPIDQAIQLSNVNRSNLANVNTWIEQNGLPFFKNSDGSVINFDFNSLMRSNTKLDDVSSLFATQVGFNKLDRQSITVSFYESKNKIVNVLFVRLTNNFDGTKTVEYFDINSTLLTTALVSSIEKKMVFKKNLSLAIDAKKEDPKKDSGCGQKVADCMDDAYTKAGWGSVLLTLTSVIEPWTVVGVVGGCALQNC
jgi:hypothetical protein